MRDENLIFGEYRATPTRELEEELMRALRAHAHAVVWQLLHETNLDIVNWGVFQGLRGKEEFRGDSKFSTWFHRVVTNLCLQNARQRRSRREVPLDMDIGYEPHRGPAFLLSAIKQGLQKQERDLLDLKVTGLDFSEIASKLQITVQNARRRWTRLRRKLEKQYVGN